MPHRPRQYASVCIFQRNSDPKHWRARTKRASHGLDSRAFASRQYFRSGKFMKNKVVVAVGTASLLATGASLAQNGNMMNGGVWGTGWMGGYGGIWIPILLVIVVAGVVAWLVKQKGR